MTNICFLNRAALKNTSTVQNIYMYIVLEKKGTVVFNYTGLFLSDISRHSIHLYFNQRVHNGVFVFVHLGELLG